MAYQFLITNTTNSSRYVNSSDQINNQALKLSFGIGYTQALFAKNQVYPVFGISETSVIGNPKNLLAAFIGLNIKLGSNNQ